MRTSPRAPNCRSRDLRDEFGSTLAILAAHIKEIDRQVLAGGDADMAEEPPRERLFDVLMRRLELLAPHKEAVRSLLRSAARNPGLALALNGLAVRSQHWMLTAAGIDVLRPEGPMRAQGLAVLFARCCGPGSTTTIAGLARTMAALDRELARGQRCRGCSTIFAGFPSAPASSPSVRAARAPRTRRRGGGGLIRRASER